MRHAASARIPIPPMYSGRSAKVGERLANAVLCLALHELLQHFLDRLAERPLAFGLGRAVRAAGNAPRKTAGVASGNGQIVLVLQGGGALGAFQAGVYHDTGLDDRDRRRTNYRLIFERLVFSAAIRLISSSGLSNRWASRKVWWRAFSIWGRIQIHGTGVDDVHLPAIADPVALQRSIQEAMGLTPTGNAVPPAARV